MLRCARTLGAALVVALLLAPRPARADHETRLLPAALSLGHPVGVPTSRPAEAWSGVAWLQLGYGQLGVAGENKAQYDEAQLGVGVGFFKYLELLSYLTARYLDPAPSQRLALEPLQLQLKVALRRLATEGESSGVALVGGARLPLGEATAAPNEDPRIGMRFGLIGDQRFHFGLLVSVYIGAELRLPDANRRITALYDMTIGLSYEVWQRVHLNVFVSGSMRLSLTDLPQSRIGFPVTGTAGLEIVAGRDVFLQAGACYDYTRPVDYSDTSGFCVFSRLLYRPGRARSLEREAHQKESSDIEEEARRVKPSPPAGRNLLASPAPKDCSLSQKTNDATAAVARANHLYLAPALAQRGMEAVEEVVRGTAMGIGVTAMLVAATAYYQTSMALTLKFLQWLGVTSLSMIAADRLTVVSSAFSQPIATIATACGDPIKIDLAARQYADAVALVTGAAAETLFFLAAAKGIDPVLRQLEGSQLSRTLGLSRLCNWLTEGVRRIKGQNKPAATGAGKPDPPGRTVETSTPNDMSAADAAAYEAEQVRRYRRYVKRQERKGRTPLSRLEWEPRYGGPARNPNGSPGKPDHQATVNRLMQRARQEYPDDSRYQIKKERSILKQTDPPLRRKPDVSVYDTVEKRVVKVYEAGRVDKSGSPVKYERDKQLDYQSRGILYEFVTVEE